MQSSRKYRYCGKKTAGKEDLTKHLSRKHAMEELSRVDRKRVDEYTQQKSRWQTVSGGSPVSRRGALAVLAGGVPVVGGLAAAAGSSLPPSGSTDGSVADRSPPQTDSHEISNSYYRDPNNWRSSGPDSHSVTDTGVYENGVDLNYDSDDFSATYEFSVTAQATAEIEFDWNWRFCHSFFKSDAKAYNFADTPSGRSEQLLRDSGGCIETRTGTVNMTIYQGMDWGIKIEGSHGDLRKEISGRFAINLPKITPVVRAEGDNVTFSNTTIQSG
jgi:hypothetical protein